MGHSFRDVVLGRARGARRQIARSSETQRDAGSRTVRLEKFSDLVKEINAREKAKTRLKLP
jgi:hypothetical protein